MFELIVVGAMVTGCSVVVAVVGLCLHRAKRAKEEQAPALKGAKPPSSETQEVRKVRPMPAHQ